MNTSAGPAGKGPRCCRKPRTSRSRAVRNAAARWSSSSPRRRSSSRATAGTSRTTPRRARPSRSARPKARASRRPSPRPAAARPRRRSPKRPIGPVHRRHPEVFRRGRTQRMTKRRAVFLDRDGTLNEDTGYPADFRQVHIYPGAFEAVRRLGRAGFATVVVTHQSGVGRGYFDASEIESLHARFLEEFARRGAALDGLYSCPHAPAAPPEAGCSCAKPLPGLGLRAADELGLDLAGSFMVGDKVDDVLFGLNLGAVPLLVLTGYGRAARAALAG